MGVNKFFVFKEDGTLTRLKSSISRFLDNDPPDNDDKVNIRASISVPASAEGLTPSNNLSDVSSAATSRTNLGVNGIDADAQANALKTAAPSLHFNGTSSVVTVADDDKLTFSSSVEFGTNNSGTWSPNDNTPALTDGTGTLNQHYRVDSGAGTVTQGGSTLSVINGTATTAGQAVYYDGSVWRLKDVDDLPFSISAWVKMTDATNFTIASKYSSSNEWRFYVNAADDLSLALTDGTNSAYVVTNSDLSGYEGQWIHVCVTYSGAGPNSSNAFTAAADGMLLFINGVAVAITATSASYTGMSNTADPLIIGAQSGIYSKGSIRDVKIFNRSLTSTEIAELARGNDLGFSEEWAGALGAVYTSDFSNPDVGGDEDLDGFAGGNATADGNIDSIGGEDDNLRLTIDTTANAHAVYRSSVFTANKRYRVDFDFYIPLSNTALDGLIAYCGTSDIVEIGSYPSPSVNAWNRFSGEFVATATANADRLIVYATDGGATGFSDGGAGTDVLYIRNIKITEIGTLADFRSEDYNESASKLLDRSSNNFVGVGTSVTLTGNQRHISADTIDLKNLPTSSAGLSAGEVWSNSGVLTVV